MAARLEQTWDGVQTSQAGDNSQDIQNRLDALQNSSEIGTQNRKVLKDFVNSYSKDQQKRLFTDNHFNGDLNDLLQRWTPEGIKEAQKALNEVYKEPKFLVDGKLTQEFLKDFVNYPTQHSWWGKEGPGN